MGRCLCGLAGLRVFLSQLIFVFAKEISCDEENIIFGEFVVNCIKRKEKKKKKKIKVEVKLQLLAVKQIKNFNTKTQFK